MAARPYSFQKGHFMDDTKHGKLAERAFGVASFKYNRWAADLSEDQTIEDAMRPEFWSSNAAKIMGHDRANSKGIGDIIEVRKRSTGLYAEFHVADVGHGYIKLDLLRENVRTEPALSGESPFDTRWNVGRRSHEVIRKFDRQVMATDFNTRSAAINWITDHMKAMAA